MYRSAPPLLELEAIECELNPSISIFDKNLIEPAIKYIGGDLRKIVSLSKLFLNKKSFDDLFVKIFFQPKIFNEDTKTITKKLINNYYTISEHNLIMNETDRTSVGLLFHENIIDTFSEFSTSSTIPFYIKILDNMCFSDYIDRITFQKQIWIFN